MKAYGVPRLPSLEYPDKSDIKRFGLSASDRCSRRDRGKHRARIIWKKIARANESRLLQKELNNV